MARVYNFNAGPAALPLPVLEKARAEMTDFPGAGMSVMEMSHRSKGFQTIIEAAEANVRKLMGVSDDYAVLFLQGGASLQFAMIPMNLRGAGKPADYVDTGSWASKAIKEAKITGATNVIWSGKEANYIRAPKPSELNFTPGAEYVHICSNETIGGIRYAAFPKPEAPLIADMSSEIMSRVIDVNQFGLIYAGAQKNIGPSGLALVIIRKDLIERTPETVPIFLRYETHADEGSLYNTPNTWGIYILKLVTDYVDFARAASRPSRRPTRKRPRCSTSDRFHRLLALPGGKGKPLDHERGLAPAQRGTRGAVRQGSQGRRFRGPQRPPLRRRHPRQHLQRRYVWMP